MLVADISHTIRNVLLAVSLTVAVPPQRLPRLATSSKVPLGAMSLGSISMDPTLKATMVRHTHFKGLRLGTLTWGLFTAAKTNLVHPLTLESLNSFAFWKHKETKRLSVSTPIKTLPSSKVNWLLDFSPPKLNKQTRVATSPPRMPSLNDASD